MKTVTIDRTFGSGGREVAARLAGMTGVPFFDNDIILKAAENFGVDVGVLKNMGKKRITTHSGEGGSGIGMMTLFNILRETGASFAIEEFAEGAKYHKAVSVTFDGARKFRIITDRAEELKQALRSDRFAIEKR